MESINVAGVLHEAGMMWACDRLGVVASYQGLGGGDRGWVLSLSLFLVFVFICAFVFQSLMSLMSFSSEYSMIAVVSVPFFICFLSLRSL